MNGRRQSSTIVQASWRWWLAWLVCTASCASESPDGAEPGASTSSSANDITSAGPTVGGANGATSTSMGGNGGSAETGVTDTSGVQPTTAVAVTAGGAASSSGGASSSTGGVAGSSEATASAGGGPVSTGASGGGGGASSTAGGAEGGSGGSDGADRVVLFDGSDFDEWQPLDGNGSVPWELPGDGTMVVAPETGNIVTRQSFEDLFVHVEYKTPMLPSNVTGQDRGNSGIYLNSMYELQVLDSFGLPPAIDGCGAIYGVSVPSSTACYEQEVWNTYEIEFQIARFDDQGQKSSNARVVSAYLNGVLVQDNVEVPNSTQSGEPEAPGPGPLMLQDHLNAVAFRNIWVIPR